MKIFIWLFCFFVIAVIQTAAKEAGILLGAIPAVLLYGLAWWSAKKLCAAWDRRKEAKAALETPPEPSELVQPANPAPAPKLPKSRFCKLCGGSIDPATRKCTGCGKQYFRPPVLQKKHLAIAGAALACVAVVLLIFGLASRLSAADAQIAELNSQIAKLEDTVAEQEHDIAIYKRNVDAYQTKLTQKTEQYNELRDENTDLKNQLLFYDNVVVLVNSNGSRIYHKLGCSYLDSAIGIHVYSVFFAEEQGLKPCSHCCN